MRLAAIFQGLEHLNDFQTVGYGGPFVFQNEAKNFHMPKNCRPGFPMSCFWAGVIVVPRTVRAAAAGIKLVGVPQPKHLHRFSPNFQGMFTPRGSRTDKLLRGI